MYYLDEDRANQRIIGSTYRRKCNIISFPNDSTLKEWIIHHQTAIKKTCSKLKEPVCKLNSHLVTTNRTV